MSSADERNVWTPGDWVYCYGREIADDLPEPAIHEGSVGIVRGKQGFRVAVLLEERGAHKPAVFHFMQLRVKHKAAPRAK